MLLVAISHGKVSKTLPGRRNADDSGNINPAANLLEKLTFTPSPFPLSESPEVEPEAEAWPEPGPDWSKAFGEWGAAWEFHVYLFALILLGFAVYATYFIGHGLYVGLHQKYLGFCLNVVMLILGFTRSFVLFTDPYHQGDIIHNVTITRVLWSLGSPCLTSADCLVILALVETAKISLAPQKMQKLSFVLTTISVHFIFVLVTLFVVSEFLEAKAMLVICQGLFIIWGAILGVGYFVLGFKLDQKLFGHKKIKSRNEVLYIRLIFASGANNFVLCALYMYASVSAFGVYSDVEFVDAWSWWVLQTCFRASEVSSVILVFTVSAKRKSVKREADLKAKGEHELDDLSDANKVGTATGRKQEKKLSMFSQVHSMKTPAGNEGENDVLATTSVQEGNCSTTGRNQKRKLSIFSLSDSKKAPAENEGENDVQATTSVQEGNCSTTGRKQKRRFSIFSLSDSKKAPSENQVLPTAAVDGSDHDMLTDLYEAKIEAYHEGENDVQATTTVQEGNCSTTGRKQKRKFSIFSLSDSKKAPSENQVLPTTAVDGSEHDMLTDLYEAKIEAYHAHEDV